MPFDNHHGSFGGSPTSVHAKQCLLAIHLRGSKFLERPFIKFSGVLNRSFCLQGLLGGYGLDNNNDGDEDELFLTAAVVLF